MSTTKTRVCGFGYILTAKHLIENLVDRALVCDQVGLENLIELFAIECVVIVAIGHECVHELASIRVGLHVQVEIVSHATILVHDSHQLVHLFRKTNSIDVNSRK